jgi:hypothetical protein
MKHIANLILNRSSEALYATTYLVRQSNFKNKLCVSIINQKNFLRWYVSHWSQCSVTCGIGIQHRGLKCKQRISAVQTKALTKNMCKSLKTPEIQKTCKQKCTYWKISKWQNVNVSGFLNKENICLMFICSSVK